MAITISGNGIVEANLADNAVTLAKMASGTDGEILTYDASGNPTAVSVGTDGQVLTSTGAGSPPAFETAAGATGMDDVSDVARATSGLLFNADTAAANTLDDYEEGTWTPTCATGTLTAGRPQYTKIGRVVTVNGFVYSFSDNSTAATVTIGGLPFTSDGYSLGTMTGKGIPAGEGWATENDDSTNMVFISQDTSSSYDYLLHSELQTSGDNNTLIFFSLTYFST